MIRDTDTVLQRYFFKFAPATGRAIVAPLAPRKVRTAKDNVPVKSRGHRCMGFMIQTVPQKITSQPLNPWPGPAFAKASAGEKG